MRRLLPIVVLALACDKGGTANQASTPPGAAAPAQPSEAASAERVSFGQQAVAVGMTRDSEQAFAIEVKMNIEVGGQLVTAPFASVELERKHEEVLELRGSEITKLAVTYEVMESRKLDADGEKTEASPVAGKTYVVAREGDKISVARKDKKKVPKAESAVVEKDYKRLGEPDKICTRLRESPRAIGEIIELSGDEFPAVSSGGTGRVTLALREVADIEGRPTARFDMQLQMNGPMDDGELTLDVAGAMLIDVQTCSGGALKAEGPMTMTASSKTKDGTPLKMRGEGTARFEAGETAWRAPSS